MERAQCENQTDGRLSVAVDGPTIGRQLLDRGSPALPASKPQKLPPSACGVDVVYIPSQDDVIDKIREFVPEGYTDSENPYKERLTCEHE